MKITRVWLDESQDKCIACGMCESIAPDVFEVTDTMTVKEEVDFDQYQDEIKEAAESCPVNVISYESE